MDAKVPEKIAFVVVAVSVKVGADGQRGLKTNVEAHHVFHSCGSKEEAEGAGLKYLREKGFGPEAGWVCSVKATPIPKEFLQPSA